MTNKTRKILIGTAVLVGLNLSCPGAAEPEITNVEAVNGPIIESIILPMADVFDQGGTLWCWAYSSFHTLRTYYQKQDPLQQDWGAVVASLDSNENLRAFLHEKNVGTRERHYPGYFLKLLADSFDLSRADWQMFYRDPLCNPDLPPIGGEGVTLDENSVHEVIISSLRQGAPTVHCNGVHCVTVFGVEFANGEPVRYRIADSLSGLGHRSADRIKRDFCTLMTLVK